MQQTIRALTGLRFLAAATVVTAHGVLSLATFTDLPWIFDQLRSLSALGMSIFFVLSGFVIHYTYRSTITQPNGLQNFLIARFARLYPLYIVLITCELFYTYFIHRLSPIGHSIRTVPYYVTLTQTWWYSTFNDASLVYQFGPIGSVSWSISTEAWFYLAYPALLLALRRLKHPAFVIATYVLYCAAAIGVLWLVISNLAAISQFAGRAFGEMADGRGTPGQDSFFRWLIYFSPYLRVLEFIAGGLAAQLFVVLAKRPVGARERAVGAALSVVAVGAIAFTHVLFFAPEILPFSVSLAVIRFHMNFGYAPACALLIFCCARYSNALSAMFSWRPLVVLGDASYSIYMLHMVFFTAFRAPVIESTPTNIALRVGALCAVIAALFVTSLITYRVIEMPARQWIRRTFSVPDRGAAPSGEPRRLIILKLVVLAALLVPFGASVRETWKSHQRWTRTTYDETRQPSDGTIDVISATYGANCVAIRNNAWTSLRRNCNGRTACDYTVKVAILGDPASGCSKDFRAEWRCTADGPAHVVTLPAEAGMGSVARLGCTGDPATSVSTN
jgi:peptidoglycan/LPS O-acetylase OafA/YrhL